MKWTGVGVRELAPTLLFGRADNETGEKFKGSEGAKSR